MTIPNDAEALTAMLRAFMASVRTRAANAGGDDPVDRILAAATLVITAGVIAMPSRRRLPTLAFTVLNLARQLWNRQAQWLPTRPDGMTVYHQE